MFSLSFICFHPHSSCSLLFQHRKPDLIPVSSNFLPLSFSAYYHCGTYKVHMLHFVIQLHFSIPTLIFSLYDNKPVYRLQQQSIRRLAFVPPYSVFCSISFRCGGLNRERNQKPLAPEITLTVTHHDRQKQVEVKRSSRVLFHVPIQPHQLFNHLIFIVVSVIILHAPISTP